jgi:hypothetical protein
VQNGDSCPCIGQFDFVRSQPSSVTHLLFLALDSLLSLDCALKPKVLGKRAGCVLNRCYRYVLIQKISYFFKNDDGRRREGGICACSIL